MPGMAAPPPTPQLQCESKRHRSRHMRPDNLKAVGHFVPTGAGRSGATADVVTCSQAETGCARPGCKGGHARSGGDAGLPSCAVRPELPPPTVAPKDTYRRGRRAAIPTKSRDCLRRRVKCLCNNDSRHGRPGPAGSATHLSNSSFEHGSHVVRGRSWPVDALAMALAGHVAVIADHFALHPMIPSSSSAPNRHSAKESPCRITMHAPALDDAGVLKVLQVGRSPCPGGSPGLRTFRRLWCSNFTFSRESRSFPAQVAQSKVVPAMFSGRCDNSRST